MSFIIVFRCVTNVQLVNCFMCEQVSRVDGEQALQQKLDRVSEELRQAQNSSNTLQTQLDTVNEQVKIVDGQ